MTTTTHLGITLVDQSQSQKEVTVNQALTRIDSLLNTGAISKTIATPPGSPASGDVYIVAASPAGAWAGQAGQIAYFDQVWRFIAPREGLTLWVNDVDIIYAYNGSAWVAAEGSGPITPASVTASGSITGSNLSGTNTGDQTIALTGDVTGSGTGSFAASIGAGKVTNGMLAGAIDLTSKMTGALPIANGGTGVTTAIAAAAAIKAPYVLGASSVQTSVTGTTSETVLATVTVPGGAMGLNGQIRITSLWSYTNSVNNKVLTIWFGGLATTHVMQTISTTTATLRDTRIIGNRNSASSQITGTYSATNAIWGPTTNALVTSTINTASNFNIVFTGTLASSGENINLESYLVELLLP